MHFTILLGLVGYILFTVLVGAGRGKFSVTAPATTGNPEWERLFRIQQYTLEHFIIFIPGIYAFGYYVSPAWARGLDLSIWWEEFSIVWAIEPPLTNEGQEP